MFMAPKFPISRRYRTLFAASLFLWADQADGGSNQGFRPEIVSAKRFKNPQVDDLIPIAIKVEGTSEVRQTRIRAIFDPEFFEFVRFERLERGNHPTGDDFVAFGSVLEEEGVQVASGGGTLFGGDSDRSGGGLLGIMIFRLIQEIGSEPKAISVISVRVAVSVEDEDIRRFEPGKFSIVALLDSPNKIFDVDVEATDRSAIVTWGTRDQGLDDVVTVDQVTQDGTVLASLGDFEPPYKDRAPEALQALRNLEAAGIDILVADPDVVRDFLGIPRPPFGPDPFPALLEETKVIVKQFRERQHVVPITGLEADSFYKATLQSTSLSGRESPQEMVGFRTRRGADLRKLAAHGLDIQRGRKFITVKFSTNRLVKTDFTISAVGGGVVESGEVNPDGADKTTFTIDGLDPGTDYVVDIEAELSGEIPAALPSGDSVLSLSRQIKTRLARKALNIAGIPFKVVSPESAVIKFNTPLPVAPIVFYGLVPTDELLAAKVTQDTEVDDDSRFSWTTDAVTGTRHEIKLTALDPETLYRYKIEFELEDDEGIRSFTTDANGNQQWSRDLQFTTPSADDLFAPELVEGPRVFANDVVAVMQFGNDVPTQASAFVGTASTFDTPDEFEFSDELFDHRHSIVLSGLVGGIDYQFRVEYTGANGVSGTFTGSGDVVGKATSALQPPGGGGSFTTTNVPDTQFPVILSGPTVASKTHDTAIVEWTTDEPADSDIEFGTESLEEQETSGTSETSHKITLSGLTSGTTYQYIVASTDASGNGATQSAQAVFTTDPEIDLIAPGIVGTPSISYKNDNSATVQWTMDEETTGEVEFGTDTELGFIRALPETETDHGITLTNLEASTTYFYKVSSTDLSNNGPTESTVLSFTTDAAPDLTSPSISDIQVEEDETSAILTWETNELADSFVDFGTLSGLLTSTVGDVTDVTSHEVTLTNLVAATTYFYTVGSIDRANNAPTESTQSSFTTSATADVTPPATPSSLAGVAGSEQAVLSWDSNDELDLAGYRLERRVADTGSFVAIASGLEAPSYTDQGLINLTSYEYRVVAVDRSDNDSEASTVANVTPASTAAPSAPSELSQTGALRPVFRFTNAEPFVADASLTYTVQVSTEADFSNVSDSESGITEDSDGITTWTITRDLAEGDTYYWRVRALEGALTGPWADPQQFAAVAVALTADFNGDLEVNFDDFFAFIDVFGDDVSGEDVVFDLDNDGSVDFDDFFIFVDNFGSDATSGKVWAHAQVADEEAQLWLEARSGAAVSQGGISSRTGAETERITVRVWADHVRDLEAYGLVVGYDPRLVRFTKAQPGAGPLLESQGGSAPLFGVLQQRKGELLVGNGLVDGEPVSGHGLLAQLSFETLGTGGAATADQAYFELRQAFVKGGLDETVRRVRQVRSTQLLPEQFFLGINYPNPFNPSTHINYSLPIAAAVELKVYDVLGQHVRTLVADQQHPAGFYSAVWDGKDQHNHRVGSGIYFYRLSTPAFQQTGRMTLLK